MMMNSSAKMKKIGEMKKGGGGKEIAKKNTDVPSTSSAQKRYVPKIIIPMHLL